MSDLAPALTRAAALMRDIPDFPQPGILFKDITPVLSDPDAFADVVDSLCAAVELLAPDVIVAIESRGFLFGAPMAVRMKKGFVPIRKLGKLPAQTIREEYALEYGTNTVEAHTDSIAPGQRVVIVDDLLATGGTARAAASLVSRLGGVLAGYCFVVELSSLGGRDRLDNVPIVSLIQYP